MRTQPPKGIVRNLAGEMVGRLSVRVGDDKVLRRTRIVAQCREGARDIGRAIQFLERLLGGNGIGGCRPSTE